MMSINPNQSESNSNDAPEDRFVDALLTHINSMDYSYWCSHLNQTTRIAWSSNHFATELPSLLQVKRYSTCLLEIHY